MASDIVLHRAVFQTVVLSDGATVQCYGTCDLDPQDKFEKQPNFNVSRCEGKRLRLGCEDHTVMKIHLANLGQMNPAFEICHHREPIGCIKNVADALEKKCLGVSRCTFDVTNEPLIDVCGFVQYLFLDVRFICVARNRGGLEDPPRTEPAFFFSTMATEYPTTATTKELVLLARSPPSKDGRMFWLMTAYSWLMDKKFIKANATHLALAVILSIFIGLVLSLCFVLDHCRRQRLNRARNKVIGTGKNESNNDGSLAEGEPWEDIEMKELVAVDYCNANDGAPLTDTDLVYEMEYSDSEERESSALLRSKKKGVPQRNHAVDAANHLPPPPKELLESPENHATGRIPPAVGFGSTVELSGTGEWVPCVLFTNPSSVAAKTDCQTSVVRLLPSGHGVVCKSHTSTCEGGHLQILSRGLGGRARGRVNMPSSERLPRKFSSDFNDRANTRAVIRQHSQGEIFSPQSAVSPPQQRLRSNSSRLEEMLSCQQMNRARVAAEPPSRCDQSSLPTSTASHAEHPLSERLSISDPKMSDTSEHSLRSPRLPRKGQLHVVRTLANRPKPLVPGQELQHTNSPLSDYRLPTRRALASTHSGTEADAVNATSALPNSTKVFTVPRHKCGSGHGHTCICIPVRTPAGSFTCACLEKAKSGYKDCCITACDTSNIIQKKPYSPQRACSSVIIERASSAPTNPVRGNSHGSENRPDRKMNPAKETTGSSNSTDSRSVGVEESGYHSHGTGTDSLCSSARSTDQEDAPMFQPASQTDVRAVNAHSIRSKVLRSREKVSKRDLKLVPVNIPGRTLNRTERRSRGLVDAGPSESSLDDDCGPSTATMIDRNKPHARRKDDNALLSKNTSDHDDVISNTINDGQAFDILNSTLVKNDQRKASKKESRIDQRAKPKVLLNSSKTL